MDISTIKEGDVFYFRWKPLPNNSLYHGYDRMWAFDGQLVAKKDRHNNIYLEDTYWMNSNDGGRFTPEEAFEKGDMTFIFNIHDYDEISQHDLVYYDNADYVDFSKQKGCYKCYMLKKGAVRSKAKMLKVLEEKEKDANYSIERAQREIVSIKENRTKIENGDISIWI